jgi:hypothetical protein
VAGRAALAALSLIVSIHFCTARVAGSVVIWPIAGANGERNLKRRVADELTKHGPQRTSLQVHHVHPCRDYRAGAHVGGGGVSRNVTYFFDDLAVAVLTPYSVQFLPM